MKKRILSLLLAATMLLSLVPMTVFATGTSYAITNGTPEIAKETNHGYITIDKATAAEGETVTVTVNPAEGYQLKSLTVTPVFTVTFDLNGITGTAPEAQTITSGEKATKPADPTDTVHTFAGWYKTKDATTGALSDPWDFDNGTVTANMTLYAQWTRTLESIYTGSDIPKVTNNSAPDDAWENGDGGKAFIAYSTGNTVLYLYKQLEPSGAKQLSCRKTENFTKIGDDYVLDYYLSSSFYGKYTLHMTDGKFTSVTYDGTGTDYEELSGTYFPVSQCIAAGTMISMPEGNQKAVEELEIGDVINTFDHETGEVSSAPVCFIWESKNAGNAFTLTFEDDVEVTVIEEHGFYDREEQKYVFINLQNAEEYIGDHFYNADTDSWLALKNCEALNESIDAYAIITSGDLNHMSNGMLSMCDGTVKVLANIFEYDNQMKFDADKKKADIEAYGLTPKEKILELEGFIESDYDDYNLQYLNVAIGKGLTTWEWIEAFSDYCVENGLVDIYSGSETAEKNEAPKMLLMSATAPKTLLGSTPKPTPQDGIEIKANENGTYTFIMPGYPVIVTAEFEEKAITIADILPDDFPTFSWPLPDNVWKNSVGSKMYINNNGLTFGGVNLYNILSKPVTKDGNNYKYISNPYTITFVMDSDKLVKVITEGAENTDNNGEYIPSHTHNPVKVNGQAATETDSGWKDYYKCDCGALFADENGTTPIENLDTWKAQGGNIPKLTHNPTLSEGKPATFNEPGYKPYYLCNNCGKYYYSEDATGLIEIPDINAWKTKGGAGYIPSGKEKLTVTDFDEEPVLPGAETYEVKEDGIHIYSGDIVFSGEIDEKVFIEGPDQAATFTNLVIKNSVYANNLSENVTIYMDGATIEGNVSATGNGTDDLYLCISIENDNEIKGDVTSDGSVTVYGFPNATLDVKSAKATTMLYLNGLRLENMKEEYNIESTLTATPDDASKPITFAVKKEAVFPDDEEFIINGGKPFAYGEDYNIAPPVVCDENGTPFDPQPELTVVYYEYITDGEWDWEFKALDGKPTKEGTYLITFYMPESDLYYTGSRFYEYKIGHNIQMVEGKVATTEEAGYKAYYECKGCGKFYEDASGLVEITDLDAWKAQGGNGYIAKLEKESKSPETGDTSNMTLWVMLLALSSIGLCACLVLGKKRKNVQ